MEYTEADMGIGLLGCGAIGAGLAEAMNDGRILGVNLKVIYDEDIPKANALAIKLPTKPEVAVSFEKFISTSGVSMIIEAAAQSALHEYSEKIIESGRHLVVMSVGALLQDNLYSKLDDIARRVGCQIFIPSGAVGGIDAIKASRNELDEVILTTTKHPDTLLDVGDASDTAAGIKYPKMIFDGYADEAVKRFPFNINVAATISLAGIGPQKTRVRIIADDSVSGNIHEVYVRAKSGEMQFKMYNQPHPSNPRTSYLALLAAIETIRYSAYGGVRIGT